MTPQRIAIAALAGLALAALLGWSAHRHRLVARCAAEGGIWNGRQSQCTPDPHRITIQRELYRS